MVTQKYWKKERKEKILLTGIMTAAMVMCLGVTPAFAGNTNYATGKVTNV